MYLAPYPPRTTGRLARAGGVGGLESYDSFNPIPLDALGNSVPYPAESSSQPRILGTLKKGPSVSGAFISTFSKGKLGSTTSSRNTLCNGSACAIGSTPAVSTSLILAIYPRIDSSCPVRRIRCSSSSASRESIATWRTSSSVSFLCESGEVLSAAMAAFVSQLTHAGNWATTPVTIQIGGT